MKKSFKRFRLKSDILSLGLLPTYPSNKSKIDGFEWRIVWSSFEKLIGFVRKPCTPLLNWLRVKSIKFKTPELIGRFFGVQVRGESRLAIRRSKARISLVPLREFSKSKEKSLLNPLSIWLLAYPKAFFFFFLLDPDTRNSRNRPVNPYVSRRTRGWLSTNQQKGMEQWISAL